MTGIQCRTMLSQRPCGSVSCTREECSKPLSTAESVSEGADVPQSLYTLTGLSGRDVERLEQALRMLRSIYTRDSTGYRETSELGSRVSDLKWSE